MLCQLKSNSMSALFFLMYGSVQNVLEVTKTPLVIDIMVKQKHGLKTSSEWYAPLGPNQVGEGHLSNR